MNSTQANDKMISVETAVQLWRSGGIDSDGALEQVRQLLREKAEEPAFSDAHYDKPLG